MSRSRFDAKFVGMVPSVRLRHASSLRVEESGLDASEEM